MLCHCRKLTVGKTNKKEEENSLGETPSNIDKQQIYTHSMGIERQD
jgi:hypothetical protein